VAQDSVDGGVQGKCLFEDILPKGKQKVSWNHWSNTRALILNYDLLQFCYPGYFIVQDLIAEARSMGVSVDQEGDLRRDQLHTFNNQYWPWCIICFWAFS
jgi:hypothetical protein